ncbi:MAG: polysaccharide export protein [Armatimonadetes bacterium]|nr:polysaccharide export protein [Armatimonadota bacterium]
MRNLFLALLLLMGTVATCFAQSTLDPYRLKVEDVIAIRVFGEDDMSVDGPINFDGTISVPFLGFVKAAGRTTPELEAFIRDELKRQQYFIDPQVTVNVIQFKPLRASVVGGVIRAGEFTYKPGDRVLGLITQAQGPQFNRANLRKATLVRKGSMEQIPLDLHSMLTRGDLSQNFELRDGDIINIPETRTNRVSVIGLVQRPGQFDWFEGMTLADAVSSAGGEVPYRSRMSAVQVQRVVPGREYAYSRFSVDFTKFTSKNDFTQNIALEPGDVIFVPSSKSLDINQLSQYAGVAFTLASLLNGNFSFFPRF